MLREYRKRTCFLAYPWGDNRCEPVFQSAIIPALKQMNWEIFDPRSSLSPIDSIFDSIYRSIRGAELIICEVSQFNANVTYELGLSHAWGKKTISLCQSLDKVPFDIANKYPILLYTRSPEGYRILRSKFTEFLSFSERKPLSLKDPSIKRFVDTHNSISLEFFSDTPSAIDSLYFITQFISILNKIEPLEQATLKEIRVGSLGAWISSNIESVVSLAEKIIFFVPEWKKRNAENLKIEAETDLLLAQADRVRSETDEIRRESSRRDARELMDLIDKASEIGAIRITIGDRLQIDTTSKDMIIIGAPKNESSASYD